MTDEPDDLAELLAPPQTGDTPGLRADLLRRTQRRVALGRWARRAGKLIAVAAVFAAGIGIGAGWAPREREPILVPAPGATEVVLVPVFVPSSGTSADPSVPEVPRSAKALELDAEQADGMSSAVLYRQAGDAYLTVEQDYANAARCYRLFLARGGEPALSPEPGDSWLLTSLKNAAFKEKVNATTNDG